MLWGHSTLNIPLRIPLGCKYLHPYCLLLAAATAAKSLQSCPTLREPIDGSPPGSPVPGILQARTLEWVAISFSSECMRAKSLQSCLTVRPYGQQPTNLLCPWDSLGKNTGVGCHFLLLGYEICRVKACLSIFYLPSLCAFAQRRIVN